MIKDIYDYLIFLAESNSNIREEDKFMNWANYIEGLQEAVNDVPERQCRTRDTDMLLGKWWKQHGYKKTES